MSIAWNVSTVRARIRNNRKQNNIIKIRILAMTGEEVTSEKML